MARYSSGRLKKVSNAPYDTSLNLWISSGSMPKPVASSAGSTMTESFRPPQSVTIGTQPYLCAHICGNPQGSYLEGISRKSLPAYKMCSSSGTNLWAATRPGNLSAALW